MSSPQLNEFDISKAISSNKKQLAEVCKSHTDIKLLSEAVKFFRSDIWGQMKQSNLTSAHSFANSYLTNLIGADKFAIYDNSAALYDHSGIISKMNENQKKALQIVDSSMSTKLFSCDGLTMMHIGSTVVFDIYNSSGNVYTELQIIGTGPWQLQAEFLDGVSKDGKPKYKWETIAELSYSIYFPSGSQYANKPYIELIVTSSGEFTFFPGSSQNYTVNFNNSYEIDNHTYSLIKQTINSGNGVSYVISGNTITIKVSTNTDGVTIPTANYYLQYTEVN